MDVNGIAQNRTLHVARNKTYTAGFDIDIPGLEEACVKARLDPDDIIASGLNAIKIRRGSRYLVGGQMMTDVGTLDVDTATMNVSMLGWMEYFADRFTDQLYSYTAQDIGAIMWDIINHAQLITNGDIGVVLGTIQPSTLFTKDFDNDKNVKDILTELSNAFGAPDMEFDPDGMFNVYYPMGAVRNEFEFTYPGNVKKLQVTRDATTIANWVKGKASGFGTVQDAGSQFVQDTTVQSSYRLRQKINSYNDVYDSSVLNTYITEELRTKKIPLELIQLTVDGNRKPYLGDYWIGDKIKLIVNSKFTTYNRLSGNFYRIDDLTLTIDENDSEEIVFTGVRYA